MDDTSSVDKSAWQKTDFSRSKYVK